MNKFYILLYTLILCFLTSCGGGSSESASSALSSIEFSDATPAEFGSFGTKVSKLTGGNIVIHKFQNTSFVNAGTILVYDPLTSQILNTISGDNVDDRLGSDGLIPLSNGNFLIVSSLDNVLGFNDAGSVILADPTGNIIATISGDQADDQIGSEGITLLNNGNFVIRSRFDDVSGITDVGSVKLVNASTGIVIATLTSDDALDNFANAGVYALTNGNFVISSTFDDVGGLTDVGSVKLINGSTGAIISSVNGDQVEDYIGFGGIEVLPNGNFVISSWRDDIGVIPNAGSVKLIDGTSGAVIVSIDGDQTEDYFGIKPVAALDNGNFVITAPNDDIGLLVNPGSVKVVDGQSGAILTTIEGDQDSDFLGYNGILELMPTELTSGNFVILSEFDDVGSLIDAGSIKIIDKDTNSLIFDIEGTETNLKLGSGEVLLLNNNNFVISNADSSSGSLVNNGQINIYRGSDGSLVASIRGDQDNDRLGSNGVYVLSNGNLVISSSEDDIGSVINAGSVKLIDGLTGQLIKQINGKGSEDQISIGGTTVLSNGDFTIISDLETVGSIESAGTLRYIDGLTGKVVYTEKGKTSFDFQDAQVLEISSDEFLLSTPKYDRNGINTGRVLIYSL